ncbi:unnamed protein product [Nesidiocoris tenuis]|uniref:Uncharacterized protein n=1 Tax=Nesidiocoris tenuis TaxID=355587 RepID=A0A6H5GHB2_9HEMI|nr:unnamed protein product [Nesidiocoris tenuis]
MIYIRDAGALRSACKSKIRICPAAGAWRTILEQSPAHVCRVIGTKAVRMDIRPICGRPSAQIVFKRQFNLRLPMPIRFTIFDALVNSNALTQPACDKERIYLNSKKVRPPSRSLFSFILIGGHLYRNSTGRPRLQMARKRQRSDERVGKARTTRHTSQRQRSELRSHRNVQLHQAGAWRREFQVSSDFLTNHSIFTDSGCQKTMNFDGTHSCRALESMNTHKVLEFHKVSMNYWNFTTHRLLTLRKCKQGCFCWRRFFQSVQDRRSPRPAEQGSAGERAEEQRLGLHAPSEDARGGSFAQSGTRLRQRADQRRSVEPEVDRRPQLLLRRQARSQSWYRTVHGLQRPVKFQRHHVGLWQAAPGFLAWTPS